MRVRVGNAHVLGDRFSVDILFDYVLITLWYLLQSCKSCFFDYVE